MEFIKQQMINRRKVYDKIKAMEKEIEDNQALIQDMRMKAWHVNVVRRIGSQFAEKFGYEADVSGPFGLGAQVSMVLQKRKKRYTTFEAHGDKLFILDYTTNTGKYREGTIGALNGFNRELIEVTDMSIDQLHKLILRTNK